MGTETRSVAFALPDQGCVRSLENAACWDEEYSMNKTRTDCGRTDGVMDALRTASRQVAGRDLVCYLLNTDHVGAYDDFLRLGGHSLSAKVCINQVRGLYSVDLPLDALIRESAHIGELASQIAKMRVKETGKAGLSREMHAQAETRLRR
jgi:hypothetical protein